MLDNSGQVSFEYLMIFAISLIILIVFTIPLMQNSIENTLDISDSLNTKSDLSKISLAIKEVYGQGQGSKRMITVQCSHNIKVNAAKNYISCSINLNDNSKKTIKENYKSNLEKTSFMLNKGENIIVVEWPLNSENMIMYKN